MNSLMQLELQVTNNYPKLKVSQARLVHVQNLYNEFTAKNAELERNIDESELFHTTVAKLLYLAKRVRPDLLTSVGFLSRRVRNSTKQDLLKLHRVLRYLNETKHLGLTLRPDQDLSVISFIDASYAVHH